MVTKFDIHIQSGCKKQIYSIFVLKMYYLRYEYIPYSCSLNIFVFIHIQSRNWYWYFTDISYYVGDILLPLHVAAWCLSLQTMLWLRGDSWKTMMTTSIWKVMVFKDLLSREAMIIHRLVFKYLIVKSPSVCHSFILSFFHSFLSNFPQRYYITAKGTRQRAETLVFSNIPCRKTFHLKETYYK